MRIQWTAAVILAGALAGCTVGTTEEDTQTSVTEEAYTSGIGAKLGGDYVSAATLRYPTLRLDAKAQTYAWDSGIRCVRAPCPSGETGRWAVYRGVPSQRLYLGLFSASSRERWFRVDLDGNGEIKGLIGVWGEPQSFVPKRVANPVVGCEAMLCAPGSYCTEDANGQGTCTPYATCATTKCGGGNYCADVPIVCVKAPCPPTAPSCEACPAPGTVVDCEPIVPPSRQAICGAQQSVSANCPGVTFAL